MNKNTYYLFTEYSKSQDMKYIKLSGLAEVVSILTKEDYTKVY